MHSILLCLCLLDQLARRTLHPELGVQPMQPLNMAWLRPSVLALWRRIYKDRLEVESSHLRSIVFRDLHGEEAI